ncbi:multicopper oxidase domain-containing protein (plasmid) [Microvirga sp. VF16]|nr:multicopper oxidase domain-containing protein [Microvirga sp. VF16]
MREGERVATAMRNASPMAYPMHLHGHRFQVIGIDGVQVAGVVRDTAPIPPGSTLMVGFDTDSPGPSCFTAIISTTWQPA